MEDVAFDGRLLTCRPNYTVLRASGPVNRHFDTGITRPEREIAVLREYRTWLTADVVTGKLDVRDAVKRLPAETEEPLPPDDLLDDDINDEVPEEADA